jgi:hypothetical protein
MICDRTLTGERQTTLVPAARSDSYEDIMILPVIDYEATKSIKWIRFWTSDSPSRGDFQEFVIVRSSEGTGHLVAVEQ